MLPYADPLMEKANGSLTCARYQITFVLIFAWPLSSTSAVSASALKKIPVISRVASRVLLSSLLSIYFSFIFF